MTVQHNFLPDQYDRTNALPINHNYLDQQFADYQEIFKKMESVVTAGDFTLGRTVDAFEAKICDMTGAKHCIGVGSGTDAIFLSLKALGVGPGDEVITTAYTFYATVGAIVTAGATPVFADARADYNIDPAEVEQRITPKTKAIVPVHWSGAACDMDALEAIAGKHGVAIVEDACHGIRGSYKGKALGTFGSTGCFSMHPLKNLNVWGDGGYIVTDDDALHQKLVLLRNHGLEDRDTCRVFAYNSRLDSLQAVVALHLLEKVDHITDRRIHNALRYDDALRKLPGITVPERDPEVKQVFHIYCIRSKDRDALVKHLVAAGIDAKIHYPVPMHLQPAAEAYGYKRGDFPVAEGICDTVFSLPVHEFISDEDVDHVISTIRGFYGN